MKKAERKRRLIISWAIAMAVVLVCAAVWYANLVTPLANLRSQTIPGGGQGLGTCYYVREGLTTTCFQEIDETTCSALTSFSEDEESRFPPHYYWEPSGVCRPYDAHPEARACEAEGNTLITAEATAQTSFGRPGTPTAHCLADLRAKVNVFACPSGCTKRSFPAQYPYNASTSTFWTREEIDRMYDGNDNNRDADDLAFNVTRVCSTVAYCSAGRHPCDKDNDGDVEGDTDGDNDVDLSDLTNVRNNFGRNARGDTDGDGDTDLADLAAVRNFCNA